MRPTVAVIALLIATAFAPPAVAASWTCQDRQDLGDGDRSIMEQLFFGKDEPADIGPIFHLYRGDASAFWYPGPKRFGAPFIAPGSLSFEVLTEGADERGYAIFSAPGRRSIRLRISTVTPGGRPPPRALFQPDGKRRNAALIEQRHWSVALFDRNGRRTGRASYSFPFGLEDLAAIYWRQIAAIREQGHDPDAHCDASDDNMDDIVL